MQKARKRVRLSKGLTGQLYRSRRQFCSEGVNYVLLCKGQRKPKHWCIIHHWCNHSTFNCQTLDDQNRGDIPRDPRLPAPSRRNYTQNRDIPPRNHESPSRKPARFQKRYADVHNVKFSTSDHVNLETEFNHTTNTEASNLQKLFNRFVSRYTRRIEACENITKTCKSSAIRQPPPLSHISPI